jgi:NADP-dependent 3-hydroxy acid dehydrogenase YdfG
MHGALQRLHHRRVERHWRRPGAAYAPGRPLGLLARRGETLQQLIASLPHPERHRAYAVDATMPPLKSAAEDFLTMPGGIDVVIANAGVSVGTLTEHAEDLDVFAV